MQWAPMVMVRVTAFFTAGILLCLHQFLPHSVSLASWLAVFLTIFYFFSVLLLGRSRQLKLLAGITGLLTVTAMGWLCCVLRDPRIDPNHLNHMVKEVKAYHAQIVSVPSIDERSWSSTAHVHAVLTGTGWVSSTGKINIRVRRTVSDTVPAFHDHIMVDGSPDEIKPPTNPHEFDRSEYLANQAIYHQDFIDSGRWQLTGHANPGFLYYSNISRQWCINQFTQFIPGVQERAIVSALVLGVTEDIDAELKNAYAATGVIHVLAVSGLHVSIIYGILMYFLKGLNKSVTGKWLVSLVSIIILWGYAFLTGLSPSVLRAVMMFTFTALAIPMQRKTNMFNTIGVSAFLLLLFDPRMILSVGFQLSYLAVLGIVLLYSPLFRLWRPSATLVRWAWQMTCVSVAAQAFTLPVTLYYFHQFPVYFLVANFIAIPAGFVILVAGLAVIGLSGFSWLAGSLGKALGLLVMILNACIDFIKDLPGSLISNIHLTLAQCAILYLIIISLILLFYHKRFTWVVALALLMVAYDAIDWAQYMLNRRPSLIVYDIRGHSVVEWFKGSSSWFMSDARVDPASILYHVGPNRLAHRTSNIYSLKLDDSAGMTFVSWCGKDFLFVNKPWRGGTLNLKVECLIVAQGAMTSADAMKAGIDFGHLISDSSNPLHFEAVAEMGKGQGDAVRKRGAIVIPL